MDSSFFDIRFMTSTNWILIASEFNNVKWFTSCVAEFMQLEDDTTLALIEERVVERMVVNMSNMISVMLRQLQVFAVSTKNAIHSFPNGSAGPDLYP